MGAVLLGTQEQADSDHESHQERMQLLEQILYLQRLQEGVPTAARQVDIERLIAAYEASYGPQDWRQPVVE